MAGAYYFLSVLRVFKKARKVVRVRSMFVLFGMSFPLETSPSSPAVCVTLRGFDLLSDGNCEDWRVVVN